MNERRLLVNIFTSGKKFESGGVESSITDNKIRYVLMNFIFIFGAVILAAFVAQNISKGSYFDATVCAVMIAVAASGFILARIVRVQTVAAVFTIVSYGLFCSLLIWNGDAQGAGFLFIYIYPLLTILLLGMKTGIGLSCVQLAVTAVQVFIPSVSRFSYPFDVSIRMVTVYVLVLSITVVFERTRQTKDRLNQRLTTELKTLNENLQQMVEEKSSRLIKLHDTFGRYLPDKVIKQLLESPGGPSLWGEKRYITIMTSDIRGFTPLAERCESEKVVMLLNHYFSVMVEIIHAFSGTIIEFLGDSILCIFGAPLEDEYHADKAAACALKMQSAMKDVNIWAAGNGFPEIEMGIAINTGDAIVGNIGSDRVMKYNVIGSNVNLSSRIESYTTGGQVMLSEYTYNALRSPVHIVQKTQVNPKGVSIPIMILQIDAIGEPFNIVLDSDAAQIRPLDPPLPVLCFPIRDKHIETDGFNALLTHLSAKEGRLLPGAGMNTLAVFDELRMRISGREVLAKIVSLEDGVISLRFTAALSDPLVPGSPVVPGVIPG
ncbi:MAG: adenylate/guanylate cyclase domain-containing protein [Treponema sp.]|jgi:class 3 adenylate cyclase|nr:adenylate/guanylate cyclase domain-containing protein [Treponema sp.]